MKANLVFLFLALAATSTLAGCSGSVASDVEGDDVSIDEALKANVTPGDFKLYATAGEKPSANCDRFTRLSLKAASSSTATLEEVVEGTCKIAVVPNKRSYRLRLDAEECGSRIYAGSVTKNGKRSTIKIADHRARKCRDLRPAKLVVEETSAEGVSGVLYSQDTHLVVPVNTTSFTFEAKDPQPFTLGCDLGGWYQLDVAKASLFFEECQIPRDFSRPAVPKKGFISLDAAAMDAVMTAASAVQPSNATSCSTDKPRFSLTVDAPLGKQTYTDGLHACQGDGPFVDNLDGLRDALRAIVATVAPTEITEAGDGKTFIFEVGQLISVALPYDPASGSTWTVTHSDPGLGDPVQRSRDAIQTFLWLNDDPDSVGEHKVILAYGRGSSAPTKTFSFTAKIKPQGI